ncbi:TRAP transporter small permease [Histidinibacterium aquaticum]|uniref:TRAP transporter small permease protein n=1 Tax=Histidinibacterium aquaticum TaxID=2613962 RepID=A0A5J5GMK3_9RHOB|nr:TRAP transporter small permease [Histidinibacterium aquaticum]KAA9008754.1 TRAP transporter small permease [Histidinibacterium aquaticum]
MRAPDPLTLGPFTRAEVLLATALGWLLVTMISGMTIIVSMQIVSRYLLDISLIWSEEVARLLFISMVFIGAALLARQREHLAVTAFADMLPQRGRHFADALVEGVALVCAGYLLRGAWTTLLSEWDQLTPGLQFPMGVVFGIVLLSSLLLTAWLALNVAASVRAAILGLPHTRNALPESGRDTSQ